VACSTKAALGLLMRHYITSPDRIDRTNCHANDPPAATNPPGALCDSTVAAGTPRRSAHLNLMSSQQPARS
jgi:hypothetical protein